VHDSIGGSLLLITPSCGLFARLAKIDNVAHPFSRLVTGYIGDAGPSSNPSASNTPLPWHSVTFSDSQDDNCNHPLPECSIHFAPCRHSELIAEHRSTKRLAMQLIPKVKTIVARNIPQDIQEI
jgi:hypothetical protein